MGVQNNPFPSSDEVLAKLARFESRNVTFQAGDGSWPMVWDRAQGVRVWNPEGFEFLDLTAAFGVAAAGHAHPKVVLAGQCQMARMLHAMGDVHPHALKADLCEKLSQLTFENWPGGKSGKVILGNSGFEAVEAALKTALLATGKSGVLAFEGAYHGLGYGALNATHRAHFRERFQSQLRGFVEFLPFPSPSPNEALRDLVLEKLSRRLKRGGIGAVLIEPIQARGGIRVPAPGFLKALQRLCSEQNILLILDEIYTGFGRTGRWFACEHEDVVPDLICLGKALTGGFPMSACVGRREIMDAAWPRSNGEAIHTSTFLGHPVGCAMALANLEVIRKEKLVEKSAKNGGFLLSKLGAWSDRWPGLRTSVRGRGLMVGVEFCDKAGKIKPQLVLHLVQEMLKEGFLALPEGGSGEVLAWTPPLCISRADLISSVVAVEQILDRLMSKPVPNRDQKTQRSPATSP